MIRLLFWLLELGALFLVGSIAFAMLCTVARSFTGLLRAMASMVLGGAISGAIGLVAGIGTAVAGTGDPVGTGLLATILTLPVSLWVLDRLGRRGASHALPDDRGGGVPEPGADANVANAWARAGQLAPAYRQRLGSARAACAYVLHWAQTDPFDIEAVECAVLIRKRLPELVDKTERYCRLAARGERRGAIDDMVGDLESLGRMALARVEQAKAQLGESLAATRTHIASRTTGDVAF